MADDLPPGFAVDDASGGGGSGLPPGFVPDAAPAAPTPHGDAATPDTLESAAAGLIHGATAGWSDELSAAGQASGLPSVMSNYARVPVGAARLAYEHFTGTPGPASAEYDRAMTEIQNQQKQMQTKHPIAYGLGDLGGAAGSMALAGPEEIAGTLAGRLGQAARVGAGYGAASGASQGAEQNGVAGAVGGAGIGAVEGAIGGAGGELGGTALGRLGSAAYNAVGRPIASAVRGLVDPTQEAARRVAGALYTDYPQVAAGKSLGLTPSQWTAAKAAGQPVMLADLGGETTRALMRSAANTSPEGRAELNSVIAQRFADQNDRAGMTIRSLVDGGANTAKTKAQLEAEYDAERGAAYGSAYEAGDRPIWSPELERLSSAPSVAGAIRGAVNRWQDFQVKDGFGAMNPPVNVTPDGQLKFLPGKGMLPYPNMQFWDYAARNLAGMAAQARRAGNNTDAGLYGGLEQQLKAELDKQVPQFADARGVASQYFGGNNAIEAGQQAVNFKGDVRDLQRSIAQMKPAEREMFQESYADALARKAENTSDNQNITNKIANSPQERQRIAAVLGPQSVDRMGAFVNREKIYDAARQALGNSTTVRQMMEAGLAGGVGGLALTGDPKQALEYGIGAAGVGASAGAAGLVRQGVLTGAKTALGYVDRTTAAQVAKLLASNDPQELMRGLQIAAKNQRVAEGLRNMASTVTARIGAQRAPYVPPLQLPGVAGAQPNQQGIPGPENQQKDGGRIEQQRATGGKVKGDSGHVGALNRGKVGLARRAKDGKLYVPDAHRPGKFLMVVPRG
jgi:hypothetical protein